MASNFAYPIDRLLQKHIDFWTPFSKGEILLARCDHPNWKPRPYPLAGGAHVSNARRILPQDVDIRSLIAGDGALPAVTTGDRINSVGTVYPVAWMEALLGCDIHVSAFSCSSRPRTKALGHPPTGLSRWVPRQSPWIEVMDQVLREAVAVAGPAYPVRQLHLRGVVDMLAAYMGEERLCISVYDAPEDLAQLAANFGELYLETASRGLRGRPSWQGGYVSSWGVYAPGPLLDYQIDASSLFSLEMYEKHFAKFDARILSEFPFTVIHLHACGLHLIEAVLNMRGVRAIEINLDRETGSWEKEFLFNVCHRVQACGKALLLSGELDENELAELLQRLNPGGLAIFYWLPGKK